MGILLIAVLIGLIPAAIARGKGRSFLLWWFFGAALFIVALPAAILMKPDQSLLDKRKIDEGMKKCPDCANWVNEEAKICSHCKYKFEEK